MCRRPFRKLEERGNSAMRPAIAFVLVALVFPLSISGCGAIFGALSGLAFTSGYCDSPDACGASGRLVRSYRGNVGEFVTPSREESFIPFVEGGRASGLAFVRHPGGPDLYVRTELGLARYDGKTSSKLLDEIAIPSCGPRGDAISVDDGDLLMSCMASGQIIKIDPQTGESRPEFLCCGEMDGPRDPFALALSPQNLVLAGTSRIYALDPTSGAVVDVVVEAAIEGATSYEDYLFGPDGHLYVSANPGVGVLKFDGSSFELIGLLVAPNDDGIANPGALAFNDAGELYVGGRSGVLLRVFDSQTGRLLREPVQQLDIGDTIDFMIFRP